MKMVLMLMVVTMRVLVASMSMAMRMRYGRASIESNSSNQQCTHPRKCNINVTRGVVLPKAKGENEDAAQLQTDLFLTP